MVEVQYTLSTAAVTHSLYGTVGFAATAAVRYAVAALWPSTGHRIRNVQREHMPKRSVLMRSADAQVHMGTIVIRGLLLELLARNPTVSVAMLETIFVLAQLAAHFLFGRRSTLHV